MRQKISEFIAPQPLCEARFRVVNDPAGARPA